MKEEREGGVRRTEIKGRSQTKVAPLFSAAFSVLGVLHSSKPVSVSLL